MLDFVKFIHLYLFLKNNLYLHLYNKLCNKHVCTLYSLVIDTLTKVKTSVKLHLCEPDGK